MVEPQFEQILGIRFINASAEEAIAYFNRVRGYVVVPAAPALANIERDPEYLRALVDADLAIADSGFMVLLWRILRGRNLIRISGLRYLTILLKDATLHDRGRMFLVLPNESAREKARGWMRERSFEISENDCYVAPIYGRKVDDAALIATLNARRPDHVIVGLGGGTQEKLGLHLRDNLEYRPAIHCVGAALGFLTGDQKPIPTWADRLYLGWFLRLVREPKRFTRRFLRAFALPRLIWRYGRELPVDPD